MSLKIINIDDISFGDLTVDSTFISVDSDLITTDATINESNNTSYHILKVIPRFYEEYVILNLWDELTSTSTAINCSAVITTDGYLDIPFTYTLKEGDSLEVRVTNASNKLMWRGKIYATSQTDLENFTLNPKTNNNIIRI